MKPLYLMYNRLKQYFYKNKLVFILFVLGGMLSTIMLTYSYGNGLSIITILHSDIQDLKTYGYYYDKGTVDPKGFQEFMKQSVPGKIITIAKIPVSEISETIPTGTVNVLMPEYSGNKFKLYDGTLEFTGPNQVLVPNQSSFKVGDYITIFGRLLEVTGKVDCIYLPGNYIVPMETFLEIGVENISSVYVITEEVQDFLHGNDPVELLFQKYMGNSTGTGTPASWVRIVLGATLTELPEILITYLITLLSYVFLLRYLVDATMTETVISLLVGGKKYAMTASIFVEATILSVGSGLLGLLVHIVLYKPFFVPLNIYETITYRPLDYLNIIIGVFLMSMFIVIPVVAKYMRLPPIAAHRAKT